MRASSDLRFSSTRAHQSRTMSTTALPRAITGIRSPSSALSPRCSLGWLLRSTRRLKQLSVSELETLVINFREMLPGVLVRPDTITFAMFEKENARDFQQVRHPEIERADLLSGGPFHTCRPAGEDYDGCLSGRITGTMRAEAYNPLRHYRFVCQTLAPARPAAKWLN
jgi:hypothetical protein